MPACPERGEMYDMQRSEEFQEQLLECCLRELSDAAWWGATSGFRFEPTPQVPSMQADYGKTWNAVDIHPTVNSPDNPRDVDMRIIARSEYGNFVRLTDQEWMYEDAQKSGQNSAKSSEAVAPSRADTATRRCSCTAVAVLPSMRLQSSSALR